MDTLLNGFYSKIILDPEFSKMSWGGQYGAADTFLYGNFSSKQFSWQGKQYFGREVNYVGIGMLAAHRNEVGWIPPYVAGWNMQYKDRGWAHVRRKIKYGTQWGYYGALKYRSEYR